MLFSYKVQEHTPLLSAKISTLKIWAYVIFVDLQTYQKKKISAKLVFFKALGRKNRRKASNKLNS